MRLFWVAAQALCLAKVVLAHPDPGLPENRVVGGERANPNKICDPTVVGIAGCKEEQASTTTTTTTLSPGSTTTTAPIPTITTTTQPSTYPPPTTAPGGGETSRGFVALVHCHGSQSSADHEAVMDALDSIVKNTCDVLIDWD